MTPVDLAALVAIGAAGVALAAVAWAKRRDIATWLATAPLPADPIGPDEDDEPAVDGPCTRPDCNALWAWATSLLAAVDPTDDEVWLWWLRTHGVNTRRETPR